MIKIITAHYSKLAYFAQLCMNADEGKLNLMPQFIKFYNASFAYLSALSKLWSMSNLYKRLKSKPSISHPCWYVWSYGAG